ncbi:hypothetical protein BC628DRAFT_1459064 [Trametes gibbosa]|nr:hypothetical protein BC628DRAFT_1459064 [Trametes gibbosa]
MASTSRSSSATSSLSPSVTDSTTSSPTASSTLLDGGTTSNSSASDFFSTPTSSGATATGTQDSTPSGPPSSSLYLFTFLATLFLLLAISSAIIMRGIFLRRRFRRRIEEAIAAGVLLSPSDEGPGGFGRSGGGRRKLKRPVLFDVSVLPPYFSTANPQDGKWERTMPVLASVASEKPGLDPLPATDATPPSNPPMTNQYLSSVLERAGYIFPRARLRRATPPPPRNEPPNAPSSAGDIPLEQKDPVLRAAEVQVAVIIAMPDPHRTAYVSPGAPLLQAGVRLSDPGKGKARECGAWDDGEEEGVPDVVLGSAKVVMGSEDRNERESS